MMQYPSSWTKLEGENIPSFLSSGAKDIVVFPPPF
jgi:hypothetical protein